MIMKKILLYGIMAAIITSGCRKIEVDGDDSSNGGGGGQEESLVLSGKINPDRTLKAGNTYKLRGIVL